MDPIRQAAILVAALDMDAADALLEQMPDDFAAAVRNRVMELDDVDPAEEQAVIGQFLGKEEGSQVDSLELSGELNSDSAAVSLEDFLKAKDENTDETGEHSASLHEESATPFEFLQDCDETTLLGVIEREHPQTIALVLSHVDSVLAAAVLGRLPDDLQVDVARRIAALENVDGQTLAEIDLALRALAQTRQPACRPGWSAIQRIIASSDGSGSNILKNLERADQQLASQLSAATEATRGPTAKNLHSASQFRTNPKQVVIPPVEFGDLMQLTDSDLGKVLQKADGRTLLLALAGAEPAFIQKVYDQLPRDDARTLRRQIEQQGTIRLRDVEEAQRRIGLVAAALAANDEIGLSNPRRLAVAA